MKSGKWLGFVVLLISLYVLWQIRQVLLLVFMAIVFAVPLNRIVRRLGRAGMKRGMATIVSIVSLIVLFLLLAGIIVPPFIDQSQDLASLVPQGLERSRQWFLQLQSQFPWFASIEVPDVSTLFQQIRPFVTWTVNNFFAIFSNIVLIVVNLLLVFILTVMLLINPVPYRRGFTLLFPAFYRHRIDDILTRCEVTLVNWIRGILINMVVIGVASAIGLSILGVPLVLANATLAGLLEAIPNVGPTLSVIPPATIALLDSPWKALAVIILYIVIQQLEQYLLVPFVMAKQVSLLPAVTLLSQVIFALFFGFLGLFLAIPLVIVLQIAIDEILVKDVFDRWGQSGQLTAEATAKGRDDKLLPQNDPN